MNHKMNDLNSLLPAFKKILFISGTMLLMLACSLTNQVSKALPTSTPEPTSTPAPTPTPDSTLSNPSHVGQQPPSSANCYLGTWQLKDISGLVKSILAANKIQDVQYTGSSGSMDLSFSTDGKMTILATQYHSIYSAKLGFLPVAVNVTIDGTGSGDYRLDDSDNLAVANPDFGGITLSAKAASIEVLPPTQLKSIIPALQGDLSGQTAYLGSTCNENVLTFDTGLSGVLPLTFNRLIK
ncbi:MAG TPA: hypothetical protein VF326_10975 [Anaerolineaceae bacterium]